MRTKCVICNKRPATPDEWKDQEEKVICFTCYTFLKFYRGLNEALESAAKDKKVPLNDLIRYDKFH